MVNPETIEHVRQVIKRRCTDKVLADVDHPLVYDATQMKRCNEIVKQSIIDASWAPFHYDRAVDGLAEPWRIYWLDCQASRELSHRVRTHITDLKPSSKLPGLLAGCGCTVLFNWLPQIDGNPDKLDRINEEHLAATAAVVQNFLLLMTAAGFNTYWSSGGLWETHLFKPLRIGPGQRSIAVVFVHFPDGKGDFKVVHGKNRDRHCHDSRWLKQIELAD